eukprot:gene2473-3213_t
MFGSEVHGCLARDEDLIEQGVLGKESIAVWGYRVKLSMTVWGYRVKLSMTVWGYHVKLSMIVWGYRVKLSMTMWGYRVKLSMTMWGYRVKLSMTVWGYRVKLSMTVWGYHVNTRFGWYNHIQVIQGIGKTYGEDGMHRDKGMRQAFDWVPTTMWENAGAGTSNATSWADEIDRYQRDVGKVSKIQDVIPVRGKQGAVYGLTMRDFWDKRLGNEYTGVPIQHAGKDTNSSIQNLPNGICGNDVPLHEGVKIRHAGMDTKSSVDFTWGKDVQDAMSFDQVYSLAHTDKDTASNIELHYTPGKTPPNTKGKRIHKTKHKSQSQLQFTPGGMMGEGTDMAFDEVYSMAHADKDTFSHMKTFGDEGEATLSEIGLHKLYASEHSHLDTYSQIVFGNEKTLRESPPPRIVHGRRIQ